METMCKYCSRKYVYLKSKGHTKTYCNSCSVNRRKYQVKRKMVEYKGGKCQRCGYSRCLRALVFHHRDPNEKGFLLSRNYTRKWEVLKIELDKCDIFCSNCHREVHDEIEGCKYDQDLEVPQRKKREVRGCQNCGQEFKVLPKKKLFCSWKCFVEGGNRAPEKAVLEKLVWSMPSTSLSKRLGVSDSAIVKWCRKYGIEKPGRGYWMKKRAAEKLRATKIK